jgi:hypothetical protein
MSQLLTLSVIWGFIYLFCAVESGSTKFRAVDLTYRNTYQILAPICTGGFFSSLPTFFGLPFFGDAALREEFIHVSLPTGRIES